MAWLSGYDQRIKLTIDNTKIDADSSNFPITAFFTPTQAEEIFTEFDADSDYMKCAFTTSDGTTQLYAEKELFTVNGVSQYPPAQSDTYVKSTTKWSTSHWAYCATDPTKSLTGSWTGNSWMSASLAATNQRFHIDIGSAKIIKRIYYENNHNSGASTDVGVQNFTFWGSNTGAGTFDDLVYSNDEGWTQLTTSQSTFDQHTGSDVADPKYITVTNTTAYRYYAFKFADCYGSTQMGVRRIELQLGEAIYHVKVTSISSSADTDIYYYYDNDHADNTTYIGAINTTAGGHVWDANFKAVYHMVDATTSTVVDSTSNNNDGTKKGANEPIEATGKVGQGQTYDAVDDYLQVADAATLDFGAGDFTLETIVKTSNQDSRIFYKGNYGEADGMFRVYYRSSDPYTRISTYHDSAGVQSDSEPTDYADNAYHHIVGQRDGDYLRIFGDGAEKGTAISGADAVDVSSDNALYLGAEKSTGTFRIKTLDEIRISNSARTAAWLKATYNTLWDSLLTYGSEESGGAFEYTGSGSLTFSGSAITTYLTAIDIGSAATDRANTYAGAQTLVNKNNPANANGTITNVEIYVNEAMTDVQVATFHVVSGNNLSTRDTATIGNVGVGHSSHAVGLDVQVGDYIGIWYATGRIDAVWSGDGTWYNGSDKIPCTNQPFSVDSPATISLYGSGYNHEYTGTGNFSFSGTATHTLGFSCTGSGSFSFSGTADYVLGFTYSASGSLTFSGTATQEHSRYYLYSATGSLTFSGTATQVYTSHFSYIGGLGKWSGLGMFFFSELATEDTVEVSDGFVDDLLSNGFEEIRIDIPNYGDTSYVNASKAAVIRAVAKGAKPIWGLGSGTLTSTTWTTYRQAILDAAQWAQDNGVFEFQLGNEAEMDVDGTTLTVAQLITNLKSVATEVQVIFTNGNVSYSCWANNISDWITAGKGDIDILASNIYMGGEGNYGDGWETLITNLVNAFGVDGTYLTEFAPSWSSLDDYSADETVQATAVKEMIDYIKASGMTRALFYCYMDAYWIPGFGARKENLTYRRLWNPLLLSAGTGIFTFSGTATQEHSRYYLCTGNGNFTYSGEAVCYKEIGYTATGSFAFSGTAIQSCTYSYSCTASGIFTFSGAGTYSVEHIYIGSGSFTFSSEASCDLGFSYTSSGSLDFSGSAIYSYTTEEEDFIYSGTGSLTFSGTATQTHTFNYICSGTGTFTFSGSAVIAQFHFTFTGSGSFIYSGSATYLYCYGYEIIEKDVSVYIKIEKEISNYNKVDRC